MDKPSLTLGWLVGKQIASQRRIQEKHPIAYLYNGVQLPPLPEWDKGKYPYAYIMDVPNSTDGSSNYVLILSTVEFINRLAGLIFTTLYGKADGEAIVYTYNTIADTEWRQTDIVYNVAAGEKIEHSFLDVHWANTDVYYDNGSLCRSASDPIPVYDLPT